MKIVGLSLALAGVICLVIGCWDKLAEDAAALSGRLHCKRCPEFDDFDDDLLSE